MCPLSTGGSSSGTDVLLTQRGELAVEGAAQRGAELGDVGVELADLVVDLRVRVDLAAAMVQPFLAPLQAAS